MTKSIPQFPKAYPGILAATEKMGFPMASDPLTGSLLKTLASSKPNGNFLELGTGTGLSTAWILDGMDNISKLISIDFDPKVLDIAKQYLGFDSRLSLECIDGEKWIHSHSGEKFDFIFADTWYGKYLMLKETLELLNSGGFYVIDDMLPQANWPEGHEQKANALFQKLESLPQLNLTSLNWSTGIILATKVNL